VNNYQI